MEGAGKRSAERLLNVGRVVGILRNSKTRTNEPTHVGWATTYDDSEKASKSNGITLNGSRKNTKKKQFELREKRP